jgi:hypothetical protein
MSALITDDLSIPRSRPRVVAGLGVLDILAFAAPLFRFVHIPVVGTLYLTEVLLATALFLQLFRSGRRLAAALPRTFILLLVTWFFAQVATDLVRGSPFNDYARGWAMIGFALINFSALYLLLANRPKRIMLFALGLAGGQIIEYFVTPGVHALAYPWKFGYGMGVNWLLILLAVGLARDQRKWIAPAVVLAITAALNIYLDFRSAGGVAFLSACFLAARHLRGARRTSRRLRPSHLMVLGTATLLGTFGSFKLYEHAAEAGWLGESARQKYEMQSGGEYGLLIGGRAEILVSSLAVMDSPFMGHGSWAKDCRYSSAYLDLKRKAGYFPGEEQEACLIPAHSHLMGSWVQAGVVGAIVWSWVLWLSARALLNLYAMPNRLAPLIAFSAFSLVWDVLFSPFAGFTRFVTPFYIAVLMGCLPNMDNRRPRRRRRFPMVNQATAREAS